MKRNIILLLGLILPFVFGFYINSIDSKKTNSNSINNQEIMKVGAFSTSLSVKNLQKSIEFYESLGFVKFAGDMKMNYVMMQNETSVIGLFQGMFEGNIMTFNPGWDHNGQNIEDFNDIREIQQNLKDSGIDIGAEIDKNSTGPANFMITDPDGNVILFDQHR